ncbi:hypothetical protein C240_2264 [Enterococcus sp. 5H]|nr:hypothetical protein [Enterococcus sp. 5H]
MLKKKYRTRFSTVVPKDAIGMCVDIEHIKIPLLKLRFKNGEVIWFLKRDLVEVE